MLALNMLSDHDFAGDRCPKRHVQRRAGRCRLGFGDQRLRTERGEPLPRPFIGLLHRSGPLILSLGQTQILPGLIMLLLGSHSLLPKLCSAIHGPTGKVQAGFRLDDGAHEVKAGGVQLKLALGQLHLQRSQPGTVGTELGDLGGRQRRLYQSQ